MIRAKTVRKYFFLASGLLFFFVVIGFVFSTYLMRAMNERHDLAPPIFFARLVDRLNSADKLAAVKEFQDFTGDLPPPDLALYDDRGNLLYSTDSDKQIQWDSFEKPNEPYGYRTLSFDQIGRKSNSDERIFAPNGPMSMSYSLVRLEGEPAYFLLIGPPRFGPGTAGPGRFMLLIGLGSLVVSLLLGVGTTIALVYYRVRKGVLEADEVIEALHSGDLKARFKITRKDEFGEAMERFNQMAGEIEKLVHDLRAVDKSRTQLLQELAHDLRTPISSMKNIFETLNGANIQESVREELLSLGLKEAEYFEHLVEDLLFLAQVTEPTYRSRVSQVSVRELLVDEAEDLALRYPHSGKDVKLHLESQSDIEIAADPYLLRRLFRNSLENAFSFAKSSVSVSFALDGNGCVRILVEDDGPGFNSESLEQFGVRRMTRKLDNQPNGRLSVGLGSVVMKAIADVHRGRIIVQNRTHNNGVIGAKVTILLPSSSRFGF